MNASTVVTPSLRVAPKAEAQRPARTRLREDHRWVLWLTPTFLAAALFFALSLATEASWLIGLAVVLGPIVMIFAFIYLCISSDSNGPGWKQS